MFCKGVIQTILIYTLELLKVIPMQKKQTKKTMLLETNLDFLIVDLGVSKRTRTIYENIRSF